MDTLSNIRPQVLPVATKKVGEGYVIPLAQRLPDLGFPRLWPAGIDPNINQGAPTILGVMAYLAGGGGGPGALDKFTGQSAIAAPNFNVCLRGSNFGDVQDKGYVRLTDNGNNWGGPTDSASLQILVWRSDFIEFAMPSSSIDVSMLQANSTAPLVVVNCLGLASSPVQLRIVKTPVIVSLSPEKAGPGATVTITGQNFGIFQQPVVHFNNNNFDWFAYASVDASGFHVPAPKHPLQILNWNDSQIQFLVPSDRRVNPGDASIAAGSTATVAVGNQAGISNSWGLALTTGIRWPVSVDSGVANIGGTGDGHMQTTVTIDEAGNLSGTTHTWDTNNPLGFLGFVTGFHGAVVVRLLDANGNSIPPDFTAGPYGVEGGQGRQDGWGATLTQNQRDELYSVAVCNFYDPQYSAAGSIWDWIAANEATLAAIAQIVVQS